MHKNGWTTHHSDKSVWVIHGVNVAFRRLVLSGWYTTQLPEGGLDLSKMV